MRDEAFRKPLWFTFGNHMHWVDMQWRWGYQVLPDSIDDMLALCRAVGARGNVNFDGIGYEKLAAEAPTTLARLRSAITTGTIEVVGATYGQPFGLFCSGESNVRQLVHGVRTVRRLFGVWPRSFWEQQFACFPQLPQLLRGTGFEAASLCFQWTRHTPSVPSDSVPLVQWEGIDGTRIPTITRTALCLRPWPEDLDQQLEIAERVDPAVLVQWLELEPSPDPARRTALVLPRLRELFADRRFDVKPATLGELVRALDGADTPVRRLSTSDVFHGMTLGKNGDRVPRSIDRAESTLLAAESMAAVDALCGRTCAKQAAYPTWELDEAWRELLTAEHHAVHEGEGGSGSIGMHSLRRAEDLAAEVHARHLDALAAQVAVSGDRLVIRNPLGWARDIVVPTPSDWGAPDEPPRIARAVPAFGWATLARDEATARVNRPGTQLRHHEDLLSLSRGPVQAALDTLRGVITQVCAGEHRVDLEIGRLAMVVDGAPFEFGTPAVEVDGGTVGLRFSGARHDLTLQVQLTEDGIACELEVDALPRPDPGYGGALRLAFDGFGDDWVLRHDTPYAIDAVEPRGRHPRRYPFADPAVSLRWFETVDRPFTARSLVEFTNSLGTRLLCAHDGCQGWQRTDLGVEVLLFAFDPWDAAQALGPAGFRTGFSMIPHRHESAAWAYRRAAESRADRRLRAGRGPAGTAPARFGAVVCEPGNVVVTAFHREHRRALEHVAHAFAPQVRLPFVVRLVEFDGVATDVVLRVPGAAAEAARTDLLGAVIEPLVARPCAAPVGMPAPKTWVELRLRLRPREIATVMLDLHPGDQPAHGAEDGAAIRPDTTRG